MVFGSGTVVLPDNIAFQINPTSFFGTTDFPKMPVAQGTPVDIESTIVFGRMEYKMSQAEKRSRYKIKFPKSALFNFQSAVMKKIYILLMLFFYQYFSW